MTPRRAKWRRDGTSERAKMIDLRLDGLKPDGRLQVSSQVVHRGAFEARASAIREAWSKGGAWAEAVRCIKARRFDVSEFYRARELGVAGIEALIARAGAEPLGTLVHDYVKQSPASDKKKMQQRLTRFAKSLGKKATVADVTTAAVDSFLSALIDDRTSRTTKTAAAGSTVNRYRAAIGGMCTWAVAQKRMPSHPVAGAQVAKRQEPHHRLPELSADEYRDYTKALRAARPDLTVVLLMLVHLAPDLGELLVAEARDVDLEQKRIRFDRPKTARFGPAPRYVPMPEAVVEELRAHIAEYQLRGTQRLFGMFPRRDIEGAHRMAAKAIERPELRIKDLRHVAAIAWVKAGVHIRLVQRWLGHKSLNMTMRYTDYEPDAGIGQEMAERAAETLAATMDVTPLRDHQAQEKHG